MRSHLHSLPSVGQQKTKASARLTPISAETSTRPARSEGLLSRPLWSGRASLARVWEADETFPATMALHASGSGHGLRCQMLPRTLCLLATPWTMGATPLPHTLHLARSYQATLHLPFSDGHLSK